MFPGLVKYETTTYFSGPLPAPETLHQYNQILPGAADRVIGLAEREAAHRHLMEGRMIDIHGRNSTLGVISGWMIGMTAVGGGTYAITLGASLSGAGVALTGLAALVGVFVYQRERRKPKEKKS